MPKEQTMTSILLDDKDDAYGDLAYQPAPDPHRDVIQAQGEDYLELAEHPPTGRLFLNATQIKHGYADEQATVELDSTAVRELVQALYQWQLRDEERRAARHQRLSKGEANV